MNRYFHRYLNYIGLIFLLGCTSAKVEMNPFSVEVDQFSIKSIASSLDLTKVEIVTDNPELPIEGTCYKSMNIVELSLNDGKDWIHPTEVDCSQGVFSINISLAAGSESANSDFSTLPVAALVRGKGGSTYTRAISFFIKAKENVIQPIVTNNPVSLAISSPISSDIINNNNKTNFTVNGTCSESNQSVVISVSDGTNTPVTANPLCLGGVWSSNLNLSSLNDEIISVTANHSSVSAVAALPATISVTKDTLAPAISIFNVTNSSPTNTTTFNLSSTLNDSSATNQYCILENSTSIDSCAWQNTPMQSTFAVSSTNNVKVLSAWVKDVAGNISSRADTLGVTLDLNSPTIVNVTAINADAIYKAGDSLNIKIIFSEAVNVTGIPQLIMETGRGTDALASYVAGTSTGTLTFTYNIVSGDNTADLDYKDTAALTLAGSTISDQAGNPLISPLLPTPGSIGSTGSAGSLANNKNIVLDTTAPVIPSAIILSSPNNPGSVTTPVLQVNGVVSGDTVKLFANNKCTANAITSGTATSTTILLTTSVLSEGTYAFYANSTDSVGNVSNCTADDVEDYNLDLTSASITNITASGNGPFKAGDSFTIAIQFSEVVNVTGTPVLALTTGQVSQATYSSGTGTSTLVFAYTVASGDNSTDLTYTTANSLTLAGGAIKDNAGNNSILTLPTIDGTGSITANQQIILDTTLPVAPTNLVDGVLKASITTSPAITFTVGTDVGGSGILKHQIQVVLASNPATVLKTWTDITSGSIVSGLSLSDATQYKVQIKAIDNANNESTVATSDGWTVDITAPSAPDNLVLQNPASSPSSIDTPIVTVGSVTSGDNIYLYSDNCVTEVATAVSSGTSINLTSSALALGTYAFKAKAVDAAGNSSGCSTASLSYEVIGGSWTQQAYLKASNAGIGDYFGASVAISGDSIVVGAKFEDSNQTTITNGTSIVVNDLSTNAGGAYVFKRAGTTWAQEAYLKAANAEDNDNFGESVAISGDSIVIGAPYEDSNQTTITNGAWASSENSLANAGAAYVFKRTGTTWVQEAYLKASNAGANDYFGDSVATSGDSIVVGAYGEDSNLTTIINGTNASANNLGIDSGAAYVFRRVSNLWVQEAFLKAANADNYDNFGNSISIDADTIIVGAHKESSNQTTITNGSTANTDNSLGSAGAAYVFKRTGNTWVQEAYLKASNAGVNDFFGYSVAVSADSVVVGANYESSAQTTITNGSTANTDNSLGSAGAAYVFKRTGNTWVQEAYLKASNADINDYFGSSLAISGDNIVVGVNYESSNQINITNGTTASVDNSEFRAGAAYVFKRTGTLWAQEAYLKAPNAEANDNFGNSVAINGSTIVVGAYGESSNQTTITNGATGSFDNSVSNAGAAYVFSRY